MEGNAADVEAEVRNRSEGSGNDDLQTTLTGSRGVQSPASTRLTPSNRG